MRFVSLCRFVERGLSGLIAFAVFFAISACTRAEDRHDAPEGHELRIVSLSPAISRTLVDFDLDSHVVGRTPYCTTVDQSIPVVGDLMTIDYEQLVRVNPTHLLVQPPAGGVDESLLSLASQRKWIVADWRLNGLADISRMLDELPTRLFPEDAKKSEAMERRSTAIRNRLQAALAGEFTHRTGYTTAFRILIVNAVDPVMAFGHGTYLDDVLVAMGGVNAVADMGWVQLSLEDVVQLAPDAIVLVKPNAAEADFHRDLGPLAEIAVPAVRDSRLAVLRHADALLPSSAVVDVARELRVILDGFAAKQRAADNGRE